MHRRQVAAFAQRNRARRHASKRSSKPSSQGLVLIVAERDTNELSTPLIIAIALPSPLLRTPGAAHSVRRSRFEKPASVRAGEVTEPHISRIWLFDYQVMRVSLRSWDQLNHGSCCPAPEVRRATSLRYRHPLRTRRSLRPATMTGVLSNSWTNSAATARQIISFRAQNIASCRTARDTSVSGTATC